MQGWVIAEHHEGKLAISTLSTITAALELTHAVHVLVAGNVCKKVAEAVSRIKGVARVVCVEHPAYTAGLSENVAALCHDLMKNARFIVAPATTYGKNILPRVAALFQVAAVSDVMQIVDHETFLRPMYAGNVYAT